jgi:23S rRNA (uridine2552-2'-O)-methyltransferase
MARYVPRDHYFRRAKREGWAARSVYKLQEIDRTLRILHRGDRVLDLGASPGSWAQYASQAVGPGGRVVAVDLHALKIQVPANVHALVADAFSVETEALRAAAGGAFDVVLSDMAPATTGEHFVDQQRSAELCQRALALARASLRTGGHLVVKALEGESLREVVAAMRTEFRSVRLVRPKSTRKGSTEVFVIGLGRVASAAAKG